VGNTVNVADASYTNAIGSAQFVAHWQDPDFGPKLRAFYDLRVIEIPTPSWTAYDQKACKAHMKAEVPMTTQERAYTSAIWDTP
jgi:hypothetical protein